MALNVSAVTVQVTFSARTTNNTYIQGSDLQLFNSSGIMVLNQTMSTGYLTVNLTGGETIYYNVRASNYAAGWEQYTVPSSGTGICYRNLITKSTYTVNGFYQPLSGSDYTLSSKIGYRTWNGIDLHSGYDLSALAQTVIQSASNTINCISGVQAERGYYVKAYSTNGYFWMIYQHMYEQTNMNLVPRVNGIILIKTPIGKVGNTGQSGGNHLHFEINQINNSKFIDPEAFF